MKHYYVTNVDTEVRRYSPKRSALPSSTTRSPSKRPTCTSRAELIRELTLAPREMRSVDDIRGKTR